MYAPAKFAGPRDTEHAQAFTRPERQSVKLTVSMTVKNDIGSRDIYKEKEVSSLKEVAKTARQQNWSLASKEDRESKRAIDDLRYTKHMRDFQVRGAVKARPAGYKPPAEPKRDFIRHENCTKKYYQTANGERFRTLAQAQKVKPRSRQPKTLTANEMKVKMTTSRVPLGGGPRTYNTTQNSTFTPQQGRTDTGAGLARHRPNEYCIITGRARVDPRAPQFEAFATRSGRVTLDEPAKMAARGTLQQRGTGALLNRGFNVLTNQEW